MGNETFYEDGLSENVFKLLEKEQVGWPHFHKNGLALTVRLALKQRHN